MIQKKKWYLAVMAIAKIYNRIIEFICVLLITAQTSAVIIMVAGRYFFQFVPQWTEQFSLFCMTWFAMFSIALAVRDDSHVKMEVIDHLVSPQALNYIKAFGNLCTAAFGFIMTFYGIGLTKLTWSTTMSVFPVPLGIKYFSAVAGGLFMITNSIVFCIEMFARYLDSKNSSGEVAP